MSTTIVMLVAYVVCLVWGINVFFKVNKWTDTQEIDFIIVSIFFSLIGILISLFVISAIEFYSLLCQKPFNWRAATVYLAILIGIRLIVGFYQWLDSNSQKKTQEKEAEKKVRKKSEEKILTKAHRKVINHLFGRVKEETSNLIPLVEEEMAEMVEAIRKKSHESYNNFMAGKEDFETAQGILEEAVSDLLVLKEMARPKTPDSITFYDILGVEADASEAEVTEAYKDLIRLVHPDVVADQGSKEAATNLATLINVAYEQLKNNHNHRRAI